MAQTQPRAEVQKTGREKWPADARRASRVHRHSPGPRRVARGHSVPQRLWACLSPAAEGPPAGVTVSPPSPVTRCARGFLPRVTAPSRPAEDRGHRPSWGPRFSLRWGSEATQGRDPSLIFPKPRAHPHPARTDPVWVCSSRAHSLSTTRRLSRGQSTWKPAPHGACTLGRGRRGV